jgi:hypothetical protein
MALFDLGFLLLLLRSLTVTLIFVAGSPIVGEVGHDGELLLGEFLVDFDIFEKETTGRIPYSNLQKSMLQGLQIHTLHHLLRC